MWVLTKHFIVGHKLTIHQNVLMMKSADYAVATVKAFRAQQALKCIDFELQRKRRHRQSSQQSNKKPYIGPARVEGHQKPQDPQKQQGKQKVVPKTDKKKTLYEECNRHNYDKCMWGTSRCFICKKEGQTSFNCPMKKQSAITRALVMNAKETEPITTRVTGIYFSTFILLYCMRC